MFTGAENSRSARLREQHHTCTVRPLPGCRCCRCFEPPDLPRTQVWPCTSQHHEHVLRRLRHCGSPALGLRVRPKGPAPSAAGGLIQAHQQAARPGDDGHHDGQDEANRGPHDLRGRTSSCSRICLLTCCCGCVAQFEWCYLHGAVMPASQLRTLQRQGLSCEPACIRCGTSGYHP